MREQIVRAPLWGEDHTARPAWVASPLRHTEGVVHAPCEGESGGVVGVSGLYDVAVGHPPINGVHRGSDVVPLAGMRCSQREHLR